MGWREVSGMSFLVELVDQGKRFVCEVPAAKRFSANCRNESPHADLGRHGMRKEQQIAQQSEHTGALIASIDLGQPIMFASALTVPWDGNLIKQAASRWAVESIQGAGRACAG
jgi:hypothetical protein